MYPIVFFGSSEYSITILTTLLTLPNFNLVSVVTKPDKPVGRSQTITSNPLTAYSKDHGHTPLQPNTFDQDFIDTIKTLKPQLGLCVAYGPPFFTKEVLQLFPLGIVNIHPSPLPKYRGATPGPWQIINGETISSVTYFVIDELPDHGPIITQLPFTISRKDTSDSFYNNAFRLAANHLNHTLISYINNPTHLTPQDHSQKTYFPKLSKGDAKIDWSKDANYLDRFVRALNPWPIAWTEVTNNKGDTLRLKVYSGTVKSNSFEMDEVQIEGKNRTKWPEISQYYTLNS